MTFLTCLIFSDGGTFHFLVPCTRQPRPSPDQNTQTYRETYRGSGLGKNIVKYCKYYYIVGKRWACSRGRHSLPSLWGSTNLARRAYYTTTTFRRRRFHYPPIPVPVALPARFALPCFGCPESESESILFPCGRYYNVETTLGHDSDWRQGSRQAYHHFWL